MAWVRSEDRTARPASGRPIDEAPEPIRERPPVVEPLAARIADPDVLRDAWQHVHRSGGAPGIDGVDLATFGRELDARVGGLARRLGDGTYAPQPLRAVRLPRHMDPRQRELMIPTVEDRVAMRALLDLAAPECDRVLLPCAFGYRSGRSVYNAVVALQRAVLERPWVVDGDIQDFFGSVEQGIIVETLARFFEDPATRSLLASWVMLPAQRGGVTIPRERGLPLGTPVSPLIANLILHPLDRGLWGGERTYLRYSDDFVICCADQQAAQDAMGVAQTLLEALGLTMNGQKARVVDARGESLVFLGHLVRRAAGEAFERTVAHPALRTLYLTEPGSKLAREGGRLVVQHDGATVASVPIRELRKVVVLAPADLTSPALVTCAEKGIDVDLMSALGWRGRLEPVGSSNAPLRLAQALVGADPFAAFELARAMVAGKIANQRRLLQRHAAREDTATKGDRPDLAAVAGEVGRALEQVRRATSMDELRGAEGIASRRFFEGLAALLPAAYDFTGRVRRPPTDPANAMLSFGYTVLTGEGVTAAHLAGLDPYVGILHRPRPGRPSLALDLIEEMRPVIVDALVLSLVHRRVIQAAEFVKDEATGGVRLRDEARRVFLRELERRFLTLFTYELTGERVSYRRGMALQAQQLARAIASPDLPYIPIRMA